MDERIIAEKRGLDADMSLYAAKQAGRDRVGREPAEPAPATDAA